MRRIAWVLAALVGMGALGAGIESAAISGWDGRLSAREALVLERICAHCHAEPGIGVPLIGDETEWNVRRAKGFETLVSNTIEGAGNMPPLGTCGFCSDDELRRLVAFMSNSPLVSPR
jgi:cytochrome c5